MTSRYLVFIILLSVASAHARYSCKNALIDLNYSSSEKILLQLGRESLPKDFGKNQIHVYRGQVTPNYHFEEILKFLSGDRFYEPLRSWDYSTALEKNLRATSNPMHAIEKTDLEIGLKIKRQIEEMGLAKYVQSQADATGNSDANQKSATSVSTGIHPNIAFSYMASQFHNAKYRNRLGLPIIYEISEQLPKGAFHSHENAVYPNEYSLFSNLRIKDLYGLYIGLPEGEVTGQRERWDNFIYLKISERNVDGSAAKIDLFSVKFESLYSSRINLKYIDENGVGVLDKLLISFEPYKITTYGDLPKELTNADSFNDILDKLQNWTKQR